MATIQQSKDTDVNKLGSPSPLKKLDHKRCSPKLDNEDLSKNEKSHEELKPKTQKSDKSDSKNKDIKDVSLKEQNEIIIKEPNNIKPLKDVSRSSKNANSKLNIKNDIKEKENNSLSAAELRLKAKQDKKDKELLERNFYEEPTKQDLKSGLEAKYKLTLDRRSHLKYLWDFATDYNALLNLIFNRTLISPYYITVLVFMNRVLLDFTLNALFFSDKQVEESHQATEEEVLRLIIIT